MALKIEKCFLTKNRCYKQAKKIIPKGIIVHSTGAKNPNLKRYIQPDDGIIGKNTYGNHWNNVITNKCVHAFIGKDKNGVVRVYQTLPWNYRPWGCGKGGKGTYNDSYIQFEICEDALTDIKYFNEAFSLAIELCGYLAKIYNIPNTNIISHKEAYGRGYASNHGDCDHWLKKFNKNMNWFRAEVAKTIKDKPTNTIKTSSNTINTPFTVKLKDNLNIRKTPNGTILKKNGAKKNNIYTIVEVNGDWGLLKAYQKNRNGWICITSKHVTQLKG